MADDHPGQASRRRARQQHSAGVLLYRQTPEGPRVLLAHPGGPFFAKQDAGAWTLPKGLACPDEPLTEAALREFEEEVGWRPQGPLRPLGEVTLKSGKLVSGFAVRSDEDEAAILAKFSPGTFTMPWPPRSGKFAEFPEIDRVEFFSLDEAREKINAGQRAFLDRLEQF